MADTSEINGSISSRGEQPGASGGRHGQYRDRSAAVARDGTFSLGIDGAITASSVYSNTDAYAVVIGGKGGTVSMANGIGVSGQRHGNDGGREGRGES